MAKKMIDIQRAHDGDILITGTGLVFGDSTRVHQEEILRTEAGEIKHAPLVGVGVASWLLDDEADIFGLQHKIQDQFEADGMRIDSMDLSKFPKVKIVAVYE